MAKLLYKYVKNGTYTMEDIRTRFSHWYPQVKELWDADHPEESAGSEETESTEQVEESTTTEQTETTEEPVG